MSFNADRERLLEVFKNNGFNKANVTARKRHIAQSTIQTLSNGTSISVSFPGYKAYVNKYDRIVYDYRVDINKEGVITSLSHVNIIVDIYNKIINGGMNPTNLRNELIFFFISGDIPNPASLPYEPVIPSADLLNKAQNGHPSGKYHNDTGNSFDLTVEELFTSLKWISLQEDINYPIGRFQGRRMPISRYVEAIYTTQNDKYTLEQVIGRALQHGRPPTDWKEVDYSFRSRIL